ncbi:class A sortase [Streptococcus mutans]|uniref:Sortase n=1 Tax=Streptococcus mutans TaxID=1309 RepID=A0A0D6A7T0_STRMG|nr:sortase [Streptococcus mutans]EMC03714.1 sortase [Streptococcus mutans NFSM1]BAQ58821.1 sortase [Streptococcus mutans]
MKKERQSKKKRGFLRIFLPILLLVIGLALIFNTPIRNTLIAWNTNRYQVSNISKKDIERNKAAHSSFDFKKVESISTQSVLAAQMAAQKLPVIGGIAIPDLKINLPIFKGLDNVGLTYGAGTMKNDQVMGENNYALASHHVFGMTGSSQMLFSPLERAKEGMEIYLTDKNKVYTYVISEVKTVTPEHVEVIDNRPGQNEVTLVTCTDAGATARTIVHGTYKGETDFNKTSKKIKKAFRQSYNQISF